MRRRSMPAVSTSASPDEDTMVPIPAHARTGHRVSKRPAPRPRLPAAFTALALLAMPWPAIGQVNLPLPRPDPLDARAAVPPLVHASALALYRRLGEVPVGSWREANDAVTRIGGWRAYTREANQPEAPNPGPGAGEKQ